MERQCGNCAFWKTWSRSWADEIYGLVGECRCRDRHASEGPTYESHVCEAWQEEGFFEPVPVNGAVQVGGCFFGVPVPGDVKVWDVRRVKVEAYPKMKDGRILWGAELACYQEGLKSETHDNHTIPHSVGFYFDARLPGNWKHTRDVVEDLIEGYREAERHYREALADPPPKGRGGSVYYRPMFVYLNNFGGGIVCDRTQRAVRSFER